MIKKYTTEVVRLTQYILEEYWKNNQQPVLKHIHKNILWIGSMDGEYLHGADAMTKRLEENKNEMPQVYLDQQEYGVVQNEGNTCVVVGRYRAFTKPESGMVLSEKQRVTFVWEKVKENGIDELKIKHLHLSNVLHIQSEEEKFPTKAGKENYEYVQKILAERSRNEVISIIDQNKVNRLINYSEIMYIKSEYNYIRVFLANNEESIKSRENISKFMKKMPEGIIFASRSLGINKSYIESLKGQTITMINGEVLKIPVKSCVEIKKALNKR